MKDQNSLSKDAKIKSQKSRAGAPLDAEALALFMERATAHHSAGRLADAEQIYLHVISRNPEALAAPYFLGLIEVEVGRLDLALEHFRMVTLRDPKSFEAQYCLGYVQQELGNWSKAVDAFRRAVALKPEVAISRFSLVAALEILGRMDEVVSMLREMTLNPRWRSRALLQLSTLKSSEISADEIEELTALWRKDDLPVGARISFSFVLGELFEKQGRYDEAFEAFALGNSLRRENISTPTDDDEIIIAPPGSRAAHRTPEVASEDHRRQCAQAMGIFDVEFLARHGGAGLPTRAPIFIVGMPRSGSTLLEQILSSHPKVEGLGEALALSQIVTRHMRLADQTAVAALPTEAFAAMGEAYLARLRGLGWRKAPFVIDKMLGNYLYIGAIHLMFPNATIIHSVRDPVETCLGGFRKVFRTGNETTYSLSDIGAQYVRYREVMAHWDRVLPGRIIHVNHEELISNPDAAIRTLVERDCGLKWDDACLSFYATKRPVRTASIAQVRQPIFKTSMERWRKYEKHLGPLFEALGPYAPKI